LVEREGVSEREKRRELLKNETDRGQGEGVYSLVKKK